MSKVETIKKDWLTQKEAEILIGVKASFMKTLRKEYGLPYSRLGKMLFYRYEDIDNLLQSKMTRD